MRFEKSGIGFYSIILFVLVVNCSAENPKHDQSPVSVGPAATGGGGSGGEGGVAQPEAGSQAFADARGGTGSGYHQITESKPEDPDECTAISATAESAEMAKVDIIWVIDGSGSMMDERARVAEHINAFSNEIAAASIDYRVVMITQTDPVPAGTPLATSGNYLFVSALVNSHNSLTILRDTYGQYSSVLRPDAVTHFVVLTDDESNYDMLSTPSESSGAFQNDMQGLLGKSFIQHAIASEDVGDGLPCTGDEANCLLNMPLLGLCGASAPGLTYYDMAAATGGLTVSVCISDWSQVFEPLEAAVIASVPLPCNYFIPPPPGSEELDPGKVNVTYLTPEGAQRTFPRAASFEACGDNLAWYYDNPDSPTEVLLCENACKEVATGGTIDIAFGCAVILLE